ncbi:MAG: hypothetical protein H0V98_00585 [Chloroflexia bacterium]|nr:hypothetical protein [Chloroflexia bacterium]
MTGRELDFSNPEVIRLVTESFVPVAENVTALQSSDDDKGRFFREVAVQGRMKGRSRPDVSHQGIYAFAADGMSLASGNPLEAEGTLARLREALASWEQRDGDHGLTRDFSDQDYGDHEYPEDGVVLRLTVRDLPRSKGSPFVEGEERFAKTWNNDLVWLRREDVHALLSDPLTVGARRNVPQALLQRLARFHLRDIVRGEPYAWSPDAVERIELVAEVTRRDGSMAALAYRGHVLLRDGVEFRDAHEPIDWAFDNELDAAICGQASCNEEAQTFEALELLLAGQRSGAHQYNVRTNDAGPAPIGFSLELAGNSPWERTQPHVMRTWTRAGESRLPTATTVTDEPYYGEPLAARKGSR